MGNYIIFFISLIMLTTLNFLFIILASKIGVLLKNGVLTKRLYGNISNIMEKPMQEVIKEHIMELNQISIYFSTFQI